MTRSFELSPTELELLVEACRVLDELDALRRAVANDDATVAGSKGQTRLHPALGELRQARGELRRLLDALGVPEEARPGETGDVASLASRRAEKAARARWKGRGARSSAKARVGWR